MSESKTGLPSVSWQTGLVLLWLVIYIPVYADSYGFWHFLQLCNLGVLIACIGFLTRNALLVSSQAVAMLPITAFWLADFFGKLITGHYVHGGTAYMWDSAIPPITRILSLYHIVLPVILLCWLLRNGYEKRAWKTQGIIALLVLVAGLFIAPQSENLNYVHHWPSGRVLFGQPVLHAIVSFSILVVFVYWPTHRLLLWAFPKKTHI